MVLPQPVEPAAAYCAWNSPVLNVVRKVSPAIAAGCLVILKPSEETPAPATEITRCLVDAGSPANVTQIVFGVPDKVSTQTRLFVQDTVYEGFAERFAGRARTSNHRNGAVAFPQMGPLANPRHPDVIGSLVADAVAQGAVLIAGGSRGSRVLLHTGSVRTTSAFPAGNARVFGRTAGRKGGGKGVIEQEVRSQSILPGDSP